ncbi:fibronectin type III-like domain-contianing protein [Streptosporangium sp. CA-115845]|uniref:fibronectin type III-like domain-contianing protein n=1 Tax=Streptosporangium sp. CA-115845 TaxID=3240071 RepID=UPI003D8AE4C2
MSPPDLPSRRLPFAPPGVGDRDGAGFSVVDAAPGETVVTTVHLPERAFQVWTDRGWSTVPGDHTVEVSRSVADRRLSATVTG